MTTGRLQSRYGLLLVFVPTVVVLTLLCGAIGYSLEASHADDIVDHNNDHLLRRSLDIANEQIATIVELSAPAESCSDEDLARMRARLFKSRYAGDIARISDGALRCSAVWGHWKESHALPPGGKRVRYGITLWRNLTNPVEPSFVGGLAANDRVAVFIIPNALGEVEEHSGRFWGRVFSRDGSTIQEFGSPPHATKDSSVMGRLASRLGIIRHGVTCSSAGEPDVCVESFTRVDARVSVLVSALIGMVLGAASGIALFLWWRGSNGLRGSMAQALRQEKIHVHYQPLCSLATGEMVGAEALARWTHDEVGPISPDTFIPWVESMGLRRLFTRYIIRTAIDGVRERLAAAQPFYLSVNVFPADLEDDLFLEFLVHCAEERGVSPERIVLEVTESARFSTTSPADLFKRYHQAGFKVFLDDFGVGYSNLVNVFQWDVSGIKLDRIFVGAIADVSSAIPVLDQVIEMANQLDIQLVVEGIEMRRQVDYIVERAPHAVGQGWFFGKPVPAGELGNALKAA